MAELPKKFAKLVRKSSKPLKYVLFRLPPDTEVSELNGLKLSLQDLSVSSVSNMTTVTDLKTSSSSACVLVPDESDTNRLKCGPAFDAYVQIVKESGKLKTKSNPIVKEQSSTPAVRVKKEIEKKSKASR